METGIASLFLAVVAGLASVLSPCVLPVIPVIAAGAERKDRLRPLLVVLGLSITFMLMGVISSLFGALLVGKTRLIEQVGAVIIVLMGLVVIFDMGLFKRLYRLSNIQVNGEGRFGGLVLGMALGIVWVPCVGPMLSSILVMVGTAGELATGLTLLGFYSLGFAIPMLLIAYSSFMVQRKFNRVTGHEGFRYVTGGVLVAFGLYSAFIGNFAF